MAKSWLDISPTSPFSLANIPFGIISTATSPAPRPAIAIGEYALDLHALASADGFSSLPAFDASVFAHTTLNAFAALGRPTHRQVRAYLQDLLLDATPHPRILKANATLQRAALLPLAAVHIHLPLRIGDYTDFYAGRNHAYNVGVLFRGPAHALQSNYAHLPVGYHGRASSIVPSGTPIRRPNGQTLPAAGGAQPTPTFGPSRRLDLELELGVFVGRPSALGQPVPIAHAAEHLFGLVLLNDWSARDIQAWEYVPLGPFAGKNFGTTISGWVVLVDALEPFQTAGPEPADRLSLLPYLREPEPANMYDVRLAVELRPAGGGAATTVARTSSRHLLFSFAQMLAHHSAGGCNLNTGDLLGSGTISGADRAALGSLLELSENGARSIRLDGGAERTFLEDGDEVRLRGVCGEDGAYVGFGDCVGTILPAVPYPE